MRTTNADSKRLKNVLLEDDNNNINSCGFEFNRTQITRFTYTSDNSKQFMTKNASDGFGSRHGLSDTRNVMKKCRGTLVKINFK